jgi:DNA polymerase-1
LPPKGGHLLAVDYSQVEVRIPAFYSKDKLLVATMTADPNTLEGNIHVQNTMRLFRVGEDEARHNIPLKTRAKNYFFGAIYGSEGKDVHTVLEEQLLKDDTLQLQIPSVKEIHYGIMTLYDIYPEYFREWVPAAIEQCRRNGGWVYTLYGRPRYLPDILSSDRYLRKAAERQCISHIIQGTAADIMRFSLIEVEAYNSRVDGLATVETVHDEVVVAASSIWSAAGAEVHLVGIMEVMRLGEPLSPIPLRMEGKVGTNWYECHA